MADPQNPAFDIEGSLQSPNIGNYYIGKGSVYIKLLGESTYTNAGNCPTFEFMAKVTQLDHFSSQTGVKVKDFTAVTEISGTLTMVLEEYTARNIGFSLLGLPSGGPSPADETIDIFANPVIYGSVKFIGANDIGPQYTVQFPLVKLSPSKALSLIGNTWGIIELEGDVLYDQTQQSFGTAFVSLPNSPVPD
jgi:hypothetical protein